MIRFLLLGIWRDKSRSVLPVIIVGLGVALTVLLSGYIKGVMGDMISQNASFETGHVKVTTKAFDENSGQMPVDLALLDVDEFEVELQEQFPQITWVHRLRFGGLLDVPDENGETRAQGPVTVMAIDFFDKEKGELSRLNISNSLVRGTVPMEKGQVLLTEMFFDQLSLTLGDTVTYFGTTAFGSMSFQNVKIVGTVKFGSPVLDKGMMLMSLSDARAILDLENGTTELLGFMPNGYDDPKALSMKTAFNALQDTSDEYRPYMKALSEQNGLGQYIALVDSYSFIFIFIFIVAMSIVLWNTGLLAGLRRYKEFGIRLALGEAKSDLYKHMIYEAVLIGAIGSVFGTGLGLSVVLYMQVVGVDISGMMQDVGMLMPTVMRAKFTPSLLFIGFIPGVGAMVLGTALAGLGIYKRKTAQLFKELEV